MSKKFSYTGILLLLLLVSADNYAQTIIDSTKTIVQSPDKNYTVQFYQKKNTDGTKTMYYKVDFKNKSVINESVLDLDINNTLFERALAKKIDSTKKWCEDLSVKKVFTSSKDESWKTVCGERNIIRDYYNAVSIQLVKDKNPVYELRIEMRAYNEGVALRYFFPENDAGIYYRIKNENTEFSLPAGTKAWYTWWAQGYYQLTSLSDWKYESERPLTLQLPNGLYACLAEAQMTDYARTKFKLSSQKPNTIVTAMYESVDLISTFATPWRAIMVAEKPGDLIEHDDIILNLNDANKIENTAWIRPGKIIREVTLTTEGAKACIDFAATHNLQYILFDWKWYGPSFKFSSDATKVVAPMDLPGIIQYGKQKGVGVWLYVNMQALLLQSDSLFRIYKSWGVQGVKFGFVELGSHRWTTWLEKTIQQAAVNNIMVNIHDEFRPTGEQRTYPNLMTAEGIRGNEEFPDATHNTILPFTRYIAGAADYTICYYDKRIKTTHAHQLALAAIYYSPIQTLFWYDEPNAYQNEPEIEFFEKIPTSWDETKVLQGMPGEFITTARRKGDEWFIGTITNNEARNLKLSLNFLQKGKKYIASVYSDDSTVAIKTKVRIERKNINASTVLDIKLVASGGQAIWIKPEE
jgi:Glycoside hydrolase 97/Glycosyl-hydrolase 97 N-terminal/Glycosyl-hydrolase 97 C-terminal, oligomerisation